MGDLTHWADWNAVTATVQRRAGGGNQREIRCSGNQDMVFRHRFGDARQAVRYEFGLQGSRLRSLCIYTVDS